MNLAKYGITDSPIDIRWRFLISCLKCENENYQWVTILRLVSYFTNDELGRAAFAEDEYSLPWEGDDSKVYYLVNYQSGQVFAYSDLDDYQPELQEVTKLLEGEGDGIESDSNELDEGVQYIDRTKFFFENDEAFSITPTNATLLLDLLGELELDSEFWAAAGEAMRDTLTRHICEHDWDEDICQTCGAFRFLEEY
jgi:hypothetical protein